MTAFSTKVTWNDEIDAILGGDATAALVHTTPAGGAVAVPVSPLGLRDRHAGHVSFTTARSFGKKLVHIARDPRVALCYHSREHGYGGGAGIVVVQGLATVMADDPARMEAVLEAAERFEGPVPSGRFWDWWLENYVSDRVEVRVDVTRVVSWPTFDAAGRPTVIGPPLPDAPASQPAPAKGTAPRQSVRRVAAAVESMPHRLLAYRQKDGYPAALPVQLLAHDDHGLTLRVPPSFPAGTRRAGLLAHSYRPQLIGMAQRVCTGWCEVDGDVARYAPHTSVGFRAPANKTLLLLMSGFMARVSKRSDV